MIVLGIVLVVSGLLFAVRRDWPGTRVLRSFWERRGPSITSWILRAPLTYRYLLVLAVTTWMLGGTSPRVRTAFLEQQGTDLHQLSRQPVEVLIRSMLYVSPLELLAWAVLFTLVMAVLEHRIGWRRLLVVFLVGHVGATLLVAGVLVYALHTGRVDQSVTRSIDVGASYGFAAVAGASSYLWSGRRRWVWVAVCVVAFVAMTIPDPSLTDLGHALGLVLGLCCARIVTRAPRFREVTSVERTDSGFTA